MAKGIAYHMKFDSVEQKVRLRELAKKHINSPSIAAFIRKLSNCKELKIKS